MAVRIGICGDLEETKWELEKQFNNTRNWRSTPGFASKKEALDWQKSKSEELNCKTVKERKAPRNPRGFWFGFYFEHDGPRR